MEARFYYSDELTADTEGNLVQLCERCAREHQDVIAWAGDGAECCELCDGDEEEQEEQEEQEESYVV